MIKRRYHLVDPTPAERWFETFADSITRWANAGEWPRARALAEEWARGVSASLRLPRHQVWKEFKRALAAKWFGSPQRRVFPAPWRPEALREYIEQFRGRNVRVSSFPVDIACRAISLRMLAAEYPTWPEILFALDPNILVEAFPESSTPTSICFRRYSTAFAEETVYEAGRGQAMMVFEEEQGKHIMASARRNQENDFSCFVSCRAADNPEMAAGVLEQLRALVNAHDAMFRAKCAHLCRMTGIEWTSLEGYYDRVPATRITIVDIDLPFDYVFMNKDA